MGVQRFRSIEEVPKVWRDKDDPENLRVVSQLMCLYYRWLPRGEEGGPRVRRFRSIEEMKSARDDPYRRPSSAASGASEGRG